MLINYEQYFITRNYYVINKKWEKSKTTYYNTILFKRL